jgi:hypothetical protein
VSLGDLREEKNMKLVVLVNILANERCSAELPIRGGVGVRGV